MRGSGRQGAARALFGLAAATALTLVAPAARAGAEADAEAEASAAMRRGVAAFGRGEPEGALREYELAKKLVPGANAPYRYAAEALIALGRHHEAVESLEAYLAKTPGVSDAAEVRKRISSLRAAHFMARLTVRVDAPDAVVTIDAQERGAPGTFELAPGKHHIDARAPGRAPIGQDVTLVGDREMSLVLAPPLDAAPGANPARGAGAGEDPASRDAGGDAEAFPWRATGWITLGVGAATLVTMAVLDGAVLGPKVTEYEAAADRGEARARELRDEASGIQTGLLVGYVVGSALAAGGAAMVVLAPKPRAGRAQLVPTWTPAFAGIATRFTF